MDVLTDGLVHKIGSETIEILSGDVFVNVGYRSLDGCGMTDIFVTNSNLNSFLRERGYGNRPFKQPATRDFLAPLHEMDDCFCDISMERIVTPRVARHNARRRVR